MMRRHCTCMTDRWLVWGCNIALRKSNVQCKSTILNNFVMWLTSNYFLMLTSLLVVSLIHFISLHTIYHSFSLSLTFSYIGAKISSYPFHLNDPKDEVSYFLNLIFWVILLPINTFLSHISCKYLLQHGQHWGICSPCNKKGKPTCTTREKVHPRCPKSLAILPMQRIFEKV
jgi:hypothetical protein